MDDQPRRPCLLVFLTTVLLVLAVLADGSKDVGVHNATQTPEVGRANVTVRNAAGCAPGHPGWHPGQPGGNGPGHPGWHPGGNGYGQPGGNGYHQPWTPTPQLRNPVRSAAAAADHRRGHYTTGFSVLLGATVSWLLHL